MALTAGITAKVNHVAGGRGQVALLIYDGYCPVGSEA